MSPRLAASASDSTRRPSASALAAESEPSRRPDDHVHSGVLEVERVRVALGAVAEHRHRLAVELAEIGVLVVDHRGGTLQPVAQQLSGGVARAARPPAPRASAPRAAPAARGTTRAAPRGSTGSRSTTNAVTASPQSGSGRPTTPASATAGCALSVALHQRRRHLLAAGHDQVLDAALQVQAPVGVEAAAVAGVEPAVVRQRAARPPSARARAPRRRRPRAAPPRPAARPGLPGHHLGARSRSSRRRA